MLSDLTIKEYLEKTAGKNAVPAGGSASALSAALAASLTEKIANLIASKQENEDAKAEMEEISERMNALREEFTQCIDRDVEAYQELANAYKMPEETEDDKKDRDEQIQKSILIAAMRPFDVAEMAVLMMDFIFEVAKQADKKTISDVCAAMSLARSAVFGSSLITKENILQLKSKGIVIELTKKSDDFQKLAFQKEQELLDWIRK
ncbi:Formiminotetrahydrofolate cyclodeaminase [Bacteroides luti]|uniref:Formiminotetrahydrofolate cyclodeaminase n=1 Tax=Bacteroides luti TaxID=1297750 RepID=A0A1M5DEJ6_9BACE|nr:cyclodeaminase/cyclohydrolase family protein [Bacteroides luti]SHF65498.1 Formiminotetrahydrofolate cyclodeaminase [Bacteroides luti]